MDNKKKKDLAKMAIAALFLASSLPAAGNAAQNEAQGTYLAAGCSSKGGACGAAGKAGCGAAGKAGCGAAGKAGCGAAGRAGCGAAGRAGCGASSPSDYSSTKSTSGNYGSETTTYQSNPNQGTYQGQGGAYQGQGMNPNMNPNNRGMNPGSNPNRPYNSNGNMEEYNYNSPNSNPTSDNYPTQPRGAGNTKNWSR